MDELDSRAPADRTQPGTAVHADGRAHGLARQPAAGGPDRGRRLRQAAAVAGKRCAGTDLRAVRRQPVGRRDRRPSILAGRRGSGADRRSGFGGPSAGAHHPRRRFEHRRAARTDRKDPPWLTGTLRAAHARTRPSAQRGNRTLDEDRHLRWFRRRQDHVRRRGLRDHAAAHRGAGDQCLGRASTDWTPPRTNEPRRSRWTSAGSPWTRTWCCTCSARPGQRRFWFMWDDLVRGAIGAIILVDCRRLQDSFAAVDFFEAPQHAVPDRDQRIRRCAKASPA